MDCVYSKQLSAPTQGWMQSVANASKCKWERNLSSDWLATGTTVTLLHERQAILVKTGKPTLHCSSPSRSTSHLIATHYHSWRSEFCGLRHLMTINWSSRLCILPVNTRRQYLNSTIVWRSGILWWGWINTLRCRRLHLHWLSIQWIISWARRLCSKLLHHTK